MPSLLLQAAAEAAGAQQYPAGALYVVATPIGNRADLTLRALHVLALADAVACEDTRVTGGLLKSLGLAKTLLAVHEHNEAQAATMVVERLRRGQRVALASDAGTPAVSDPGARLVAAVRQAGLRVVPLPGPSSAVAAVSVAGDAHGRGYRFAGFLPTRARDRAQALDAVTGDAGTVVLFEAPHRIDTLLAELAAAAPDRTLTIARELTKQFEQVATMTAAEAPAWLDADPSRRKGEFVLVLHARPAAAEAAADDDPEATRVLALLLAELPLRQAVPLAALITGRPRNALYAQALALRGESHDALADASADDCADPDEPRAADSAPPGAGG